MDSPSAISAADCFCNSCWGSRASSSNPINSSSSACRRRTARFSEFPEQPGLRALSNGLLPKLRSSSAESVPAASPTISPKFLRRRSACPCNSRSEEHTSELQSHVNLVCRLLLEKKKKNKQIKKSTHKL